MTFHALPILLCFAVSGPDFWVIHNTLPPLVCMTEGLLYQRSVTLISKQRSSGHIGDVARPLALDRRSQLASQSYHFTNQKNVLVFSQ